MTYRELIYICLDETKQLSDDITINEEHVVFLLDKFRAALLWQKYKTVKMEVPESNYQTLCLDLEEFSVGDVCDDTKYLRTICVPKMLKVGNTVAFPQDFYKGINISLIDRERMRYVGENPFTKNIIYGSLNPDGRFYFKSNNPQFLYLKKIRITGVFENSLEASKYECETCVDTPCEPLDRTFPIEESLVTLLISSVVKEILGPAYRPADLQNNANDDLPTMVSQAKQS